MFVQGMLSGERVAVWRKGRLDGEPQVRVLLPGHGVSVRARARAATFVPSVSDRPGIPRPGPGSRPVLVAGRRPVPGGR